MRGPLSVIQTSNSPPCLGLEIFRQHRAGDLSEKDYYVMNAAMIAKGAYDERAKIYIPMASQLREYVYGRVMTTREYDQGWSAKLGEWVISNFRALDHNSYMKSHLLWAKEKCESVKLTREAGLLKNALERFDANILPWDDFDQATRAQVLDSAVRERKMKERA